MWDAGRWLTVVGGGEVVMWCVHCVWALGGLRAKVVQVWCVGAMVAMGAIHDTWWW